MALKNRVEKLRKKLPSEKKPITVAWIGPETGEVHWALTLNPLPNGEYEAVEADEEQLAVMSRANKAELNRCR